MEGAKLFALRNVWLICVHVCVCVFGCVRACVCVFSITYVPAEYLEEYKASLEQAKDDVFSETAPVPVPDPVQDSKYVLILYPSNLSNNYTNKQMNLVCSVEICCEQTSYVYMQSFSPKHTVCIHDG